MKRTNRPYDAKITTKRLVAVTAIAGSFLATANFIEKDSQEKSPFPSHGSRWIAHFIVMLDIIASIVHVIFITGKTMRNGINKTILKMGTVLDQNQQTGEKMSMITGRASINIMKITIIAILSISVVIAQGAPKLDIQISDSKVNLNSAEKRDATIISYSPGDTLKYTLTATNIGDGLMTNAEVVDPVPAGVTYIVGSAYGADTEISFSINAGSTYMAWPPTYTVRNAKGILIKRKATPKMVSHIKWAFTHNLKPGEGSALEFMVEVNK